MVHSEVVAEGHSSSGRYAKVKASSNALTVLEGLTPLEFRERYNCRCRPLESDEDEHQKENLEVKWTGKDEEVTVLDSGKVKDQETKISEEIGVAI